jgi:hypothetical protein
MLISELSAWAYPTSSAGRMIARMIAKRKSAIRPKTAAGGRAGANASDQSRSRIIDALGKRIG